MSFLTIASWMQKEATNCSNLTEKAKKLAELIESHEHHLKQKQDNWEENMRLRMEVFTAQLNAEQLTDEIEELQEAAEQARRDAEELTRLRNAFRMIDMNKLLQNEEQAAQLRMMQRVQEMRDVWERERPMYEQMEQRQIVHKLRHAQSELAAALLNKAESQTGGLAGANKTLKCQNKVATENRNHCLINIIENMQELNQMEAEIQQKLQDKEKLLKIKPQMLLQFPVAQIKPFSLPQRSPTTPAVAVVTPSAAPTRYSFTNPVQGAPAASTFNLNSFNPFSFLNALNVNMSNIRSFSEHVAQLRAKKEAERTVQLNSLRSILNVSKVSRDAQTNAGGGNISSTTTKHVTFQLNSSIESSVSSEGIGQENSIDNVLDMDRGASISAVEMDTETEMGTEEIVVVPSQSQTQTIDLNTPEAEKKIPLPHFELLTDEEINVEENGEEENGDEICSDDKQVAVVPEVKSSKVEIQECRIIKQAGTPLPKVLPTCLSPSPQFQSPPTSLVSDYTFKIPEEPISKKPKTSDSFFTAFLESSANDSDSSESANVAKRDDFEILFKNTMQSRNESEDDDDDDFNMGVLAVGSDTNEVFEFDMDSPDDGSHKRNTNNFL